MTEGNEDAGLPRIGHQPGRTPLNNVISYIERHRAAFPDRAALRWVDAADLGPWDGRPSTRLPHREISYGRFAEDIDHVAAALRDFGLKRGDRAIIFLPMGVLMYTAMFAVQRLGAVAVFLDSWARRHQLGTSAACVQPKAMISHRAAFDLVAGMPEFGGLSIRIIAGPGADASFSARLEDLIQREGSAPVEAVEPEETALVTFTTGSSGVPKGANRTHRFLCAQHEALASLLPYEPADADLPAFPIFSLNNLASGVTTVVPALDLAQPGPRDAALLVAQLLHEGVTCATLSPSMLVGVARFCAESGIALPGLRRVVTGGAPVSRDNVRDFLRIAPRAACWVLYGSTEVEPMAHIEAREMLAQPENPDPEIVEEGVNVGHISPELEYKFIRIRRGPIDLKTESWATLEVPRGEVGEFIVTGDHVCRDYFNNEDAFRRAKIVDEWGRVWHRTGDLARLDERGNLWVVGRIHNVIERGGRYCFPVRAEIILKRLPFVKQAAFLGLPDPELGERTAVAVVLDIAKADEAHARTEILRLFAKNGIPVDVLFFVESIPMDPRHHSKVEYDILRRSLQALDPDEIPKGGRRA
ncbi:MAG: AMP-binding protein [Verrucomicrobia bacterium]|nr:AMP-binding protein [Verrucomicrobiota bacterium]